MNFYQVVVVIAMGITVMNLVTAIIVNSSLQSANEDREARLRWESALLKKTANRLDALFRRIDADGDGELNDEENNALREYLREWVRGEHIGEGRPF